MDQYSEDLSDRPCLPGWVEEYLAAERAWWRMLRGTGALSEAESVAALARWMNG
ncbi:hypothetical protein [Mycobacterium sp. OTB74]|uniref:hypothetical protein n=1 Tax=Mycobacterium sp. OTB74 TaxID=1853452 RepID=UPI0024746533|nr:hypothetical protein [Mycobacterium sp. OTB74]MDH6245500.1 hypothetical protein [Mycobacterium sp. OTB74]